MEQAERAFDPFPEYVYLGNDFDDGLFARPKSISTARTLALCLPRCDANGKHENTGDSSIGRQFWCHVLFMIMSHGQVVALTV